MVSFTVRDRRVKIRTLSGGPILSGTVVAHFTANGSGHWLLIKGVTKMTPEF